MKEKSIDIGLSIRNNRKTKDVAVQWIHRDRQMHLT